VLGQGFSKYFGFPCQSSFHQLLHNQPHLSSGAGTIGQKWPQYKGLSPTPLAIKKFFCNWLWYCYMFNFFYRNFISFLIRIICVCVGVFLATSLLIDIFTCAYFGTSFILKHVLLQFIFALQCNSFLLQFM
jgi:hypothetical protein